MRRLLVVGAGGHGKVTAEAAQKTGLWDKIVFLDDKYPTLKQVNHFKVVGTIAESASMLGNFNHIIVAMGDNFLRDKLLNKFKDMGFEIPVIVHPAACVSECAVLGIGTVVFAKGIINCNVTIGAGGIINTGAIVEHDCSLGRCVHLSPGAILAGGIKVGDLSCLGTGTVAIPNISIGNNVISGAGAIIINDIADNEKVIGVSAKFKKKGE